MDGRRAPKTALKNDKKNGASERTGGVPLPIALPIAIARQTKSQPQFAIRMATTKAIDIVIRIAMALAINPKAIAEATATP